MIPNALISYKQALIRHPIGLQCVLACTSIALGVGIHVKGVPIYISSYVQIIPAWVITLTFIFSGLMSFASLNVRLLSSKGSVINNIVIMFLWVWLAIGTISHPMATALSYMMVSPPLACAWVLAHSMVFKE